MNIGVVVIGSIGNFRSRTLERFLNEVDKASWKVMIQPPVWPEEIEVPWALRLYARLYYGHELTGGEWGCAVAHNRAISQGLGEGLDFLLVLEDDVEPASQFFEKIILDLEKSMETIGHRATVVQLNPYSDGERLSDESVSHNPVARLKALSDTSSSYLLNREAMRVVLECSWPGTTLPIGKADFPAWMAAVDWREASRKRFPQSLHAVSVVGDREEASLVPGRPDHAIRLLTRIALFPFFPLRKSGLRVRFRWYFEHF